MLQAKLPSITTSYDYDEILKDRVYADDNIVAPKPILNFGDTLIMTAGNISMIKAAAKKGKTFFMLLLTKIIITDKPSLNICIFDTEQFKWHSWMFRKKLRYMTPLHHRVDFINLRRYSKEVRREFVQDHIQRNNFDLVFIDNIRDLINDFNSISESSELLTIMTNICENKETHICATLHVNPNSDKARGHLGTELEQKCETAFQLSKDGNIVTVEGSVARNKPFEPFIFEIEDGLPRVRSMQEETNDYTPF